MVLCLLAHSAATEAQPIINFASVELYLHGSCHTVKQMNCILKSFYPSPLLLDLNGIAHLSTWNLECSTFKVAGMQRN